MPTTLSRRAAVTGRWLGAVALTYLGLLAVTFFIGRVIPVDPVLAIVGGTVICSALLLKAWMDRRNSNLHRPA